MGVFNSQDIEVQELLHGEGRRGEAGVEIHLLREAGRGGASQQGPQQPHGGPRTRRGSATPCPGRSPFPPGQLPGASASAGPWPPALRGPRRSWRAPPRWTRAGSGGRAPPPSLLRPAGRRAWCRGSIAEPRPDTASEGPGPPPCYAGQEL